MLPQSAADAWAGDAAETRLLTDAGDMREAAVLRGKFSGLLMGCCALCGIFWPVIGLSSPDRVSGRVPVSVRGPVGLAKPRVERTEPAQTAASRLSACASFRKQIIAAHG